MKKIIFTILLFLPLLASADNNNVNIYFFYGNDCPQCDQERKFLQNLKAEIPEIKLYNFEIQDNQDNADLLETLSKKLNLGVLNAPLIIVGDKVFVDFYKAEITEMDIKNTVKNYLISGYTDLVTELIKNNQDKQALIFAQIDNVKEDKFFKAEVIKIIKEQFTTLPDGVVVKQQDLKLRGIETPYKDKEIKFKGIGNFDVIKKNLYQTGDKVLMVSSFDDQGNLNFYITDYIRINSLWWLAGCFILALLLVGGFKGVRSILALIITFTVIIKYIIPKILDGASPLATTLIGSAVILLAIIYITEGWLARSHIAIISIFFSLIITIFLAWFFVDLTKLSGLAGEEISFLITIGEQVINFKGLLLAGIIIGTLGVLDDVVIAQVTTVEQIIHANQYQSRKEIFKKAYKVGVSHISSMTNTLFLAYAGASLPLLILFISGHSAFSGWDQIINNEAIATEIVRTLAGSIGLILSVPIATLAAVWWFKPRQT